MRIGEESEGVDYLQIARQLVGGQDAQLFSAQDMEDIRARQGDIAARISAREADIVDLLQAPEKTDVEILPATEAETDPEGEQRLDEIRQSVTDESVTETLGEVSSGGIRPSTPPPPVTETMIQTDATEGEQR